MEKKIKIIFLDRGTFPKNLNIHKPQVPHEWIEYDFTTPSQVVKRCNKAHVIITNKVHISAETVQKLPDLELISVTATGTNNIDLEACKKHQVTVTNVVNYGTNSVAEHTWCLILNLFRQFIPYHNSIINNEWPRSKNFSYFLEPIKELAESRLAIIGPGILGKRVGEIATAFKMKTIYVGNPLTMHDKKYRKIKFVSLDYALQTADVISIHCPLTDHVRNLITIKEIKKMKKTAFLVNTSRGGIVNEKDLSQALKKNLIRGAAFDVLSLEPPPVDHILHQLHSHPRFILTPHIAWMGETSVHNLLHLAIAQVDKFYRSKKYQFSP